ncbi:cell surface protein [Trinickia sp.]|uniref:cell surface protein n=1 Tax=Trinickia sp. TaxID=2571163 RepID=UPI003F7D4166
MNNKRPNRGIRIALGASLSSLTLLAACGGGGGSSSASSQPTQQIATSIGGTVAIGTALAGATVTVIDANGKTATGTSNTDGSYTVSVQGLTAPLVLEAQDASGASSLLYSVVPTLTSSGTSLTANVTPLTTAVAALMTASGNPADLLASPSTVTTTNVSHAVGVLDQALGPILSANNVASTLDPIATTFTANQTGLDAVIDSVSVTASTKGTGLQITSLADPNSAIQLNSSTSVSTTLAAPSQPANYLASFQSSMSQCMTDVQGGASSTSDAACTTAIDANYLSVGKTSFQVRHNLFAAGAKLTGIKTIAMLPAGTIPNTTGPVALVYFLYTDGTGTPQFASDYVQQEATGWKVIGDQDPHNNYVASFVGRIQYTDSNASNNRYETGLRIQIPSQVVINGQSVSVGSALVKGPGLPSSGVWMQAAAPGSPYLTFPKTALTAPIPYVPNGSPVVESNGWSTQYKWAWTGLNGSAVTVPQTSDYATTQEDTSTIQQYGAYSITLYDQNASLLGTDTVINVASIQSSQAAQQVAWATLGSDAITNYLTPQGWAALVPVSSLSLDWATSGINPMQPTMAWLGMSETVQGSVTPTTSLRVSQNGSTSTATFPLQSAHSGVLEAGVVQSLTLASQVDGDYYLNTYQYGQ